MSGPAGRETPSAWRDRQTAITAKEPAGGPGAIMALAAEIAEAANVLLAPLTELDPRATAEAVAAGDSAAASAVMAALWPHAAPEDVGRADWWQTPLGRVCARSLGRDDAESVTQEVAAAMLGLARTTVATMLARGTLDRHPDGGVLRASVLQRLAR